MKIFINVILWTISIFLLLCGIALLSEIDTRYIGIFFFILGFSLIPSIRKFINDKLTVVFRVLLKEQNIETTSNKRIKTLIGTSKFVFFFIAFILIVNSIPAPKQSVNYTNYTPQKQEIKENNYLNNKKTKKLAKATKLDKKLASKAYEILVNCGVDEISWIEQIKDMDDAYFIHLENISEPIKVSFKDNEVEYVFFDTWNLYNNGKYDGKLSEYSVTIDENMLLKSISRDNIEANLQYPKNVKYEENSWRITKLNDEYGVSCNIEAPNAFGMYSTYRFFLSYKKVNNTFEVTQIEANGEKVYQRKVNYSNTKKLSSEDKKSVDEINKALVFYFCQR